MLGESSYVGLSKLTKVGAYMCAGRKIVRVHAVDDVCGTKNCAGAPDPGDVGDEKVSDVGPL